jgi:hypothetical protein
MTSGTNNVGGSDQIEFSGRAIIDTSTASGGMARRFTIEFNDSFTTCDAHVIFAKQAGRDVVIGHNLNTGAPAREIRSATVTSTSCSVREGNVFAQ